MYLTAMYPRLILVAVALLATLLTACRTPLERQDRLANTYRFDEVVYDAAIDVNVAAAALKPGPATIRGVVELRGETTPESWGLYRQNQTMAGALVSLYPATEYLRGWYQSRTERENFNTRIEMSEPARLLRFDVVSDEVARFAFRGVMPGEYFVQVYLPYRPGPFQDAPFRVADNVPAHHYANEYSQSGDLAWERNREVQRWEAFVTVPPGEAEVPVRLKYVKLPYYKR